MTTITKMNPDMVKERAGATIDVDSLKVFLGELNYMTPNDYQKYLHHRKSYSDCWSLNSVLELTGSNLVFSRQSVGSADKAHLRGELSQPWSPREVRHDLRQDDQVDRIQPNSPDRRNHAKLFVRVGTVHLDHCGRICLLRILMGMY